MWMLAALPAGSALADDAATVTPLDLSPPAKSAEARTDPAATGAIKPQPTPDSSSISKLDLSSPAGLTPELPPDPAPPSFSPPSIVPVLAPSASEREAAPTPSPSVAPTPSSEVAPSKPSEAVPTPAAEAAPDAPARSADAIGDELHAALDRLAADKPARRPIGAGDWNASRKAIAAVYAERAYAPLWLDGDHFSERAKAALGRLAEAGEDGLDLSALPLPAANWTGQALQAQAEMDVAISAAVVAYAQQASGARINPRSLSKDVSAKPEVADAESALRNVSAAADPDAALAAFNPPQAGYRALRAALAAARSEASQPMARFKLGPELKVGMSDPRVPLIRARFGLGALNDSAASQVYDVRIASAVAPFQRVHGIKASGALTEATASALDGFHATVRREAEILANMEMWRWEPRDLGETRVEVNVPAFSLKLMNGDTIVHEARVIVGKPDTPTPIFSNAIKYMLLNPVWHVPDSIIKKEMAPHYAADPSYFERHGYKVSYVGDKLVVEQPPGEANALGRMLFLFPNEHAVYLHDTPQRALFSNGYRALSHGCVRVEDPTRLAEILLGGAARGWTEKRVKSLIGDKERTISLPTPVPVHLEYFTEFVDGGGELREIPDLYGLTGKVAAALTNFRRD